MFARPVTDSSDRPTHSSSSAGGRLVSADGRALPLRHAHLSATARGGLARVCLRQRFVNVHAEPLAVTYQLALPHDAAVSGYTFELGDRRVVGVVESREAARAQFERAILEGHTAALLEEERGSLFTQELGNVPAGAELTVEVTLDQRLLWERPGGWVWRFPTVVAPRYAGSPGRVADAERVFVDVHEQDGGVTCALELELGDGVTAAEVTSPSHALRVREAAHGARVEFAEHATLRSPTSASYPDDDDPRAPRAASRPAAGVPLDRDVVIRWPSAHRETAASLETSGRVQLDGVTARFGLLTLTPPRDARVEDTVCRDLVLLLDTSGSMSGEPLAQAKAVVAELIRGLHPRDTLEMVEFSNVPRRWHRGPTNMDAKARSRALEFISGLKAAGGTEMVSGILEALAPRRTHAQRQVILVTDGLIGFEHEVLAAAIRKLDARTRIHVLGVGSAVNRSLTSPLARAGRGVEVIVGLGESPARAAQTLRARTEAPVCLEVTVEGEALQHTLQRVPDLFDGAPVLVPMVLSAQGGELTVRGRLGTGEMWSQRLFVASLEEEVLPRQRRTGALSALYAREAVEDLELARAVEPEAARAIDARIETLGLRHQIATRRTSFVAVSEERTVDPREPTRRVTMPQAWPHGMSAEGLGLRAAAASFGSLGATFAPQAFAGIAPPAPMMRARAAAPTGGVAKQGFTGILAEGAREFLKKLAPRSARDESALSAPKGRHDARHSAQSEDDAEELAAGDAARARVMFGRVRSADREHLVVEVTLTEDFDWLAGGAVTLLFTNTGVDTHVEAKLDAGASTRAGHLSAGQMLRLVVRLPQETLDPGQLTAVTDPARAWRIELFARPEGATR